MHLSATGHPGPEAIVAFIDGTVGREVASHIQGCASCSSDAAALDAAQSRLRLALHRFDCPEPHRLGEYELGLVSALERVEIATHALECPACAEELQGLRVFMATEPSFSESIAAQLRRVFATLLTPRPSIGLAGIRGSDTKLRQYQVNDARLSIGPGPERGSLIGLLLMKDGVTPAAEARLLPEHGSAYVGPVDELGNFEFEDLPPGDYVLEIHLSDAIIVVQHLPVE